VYLTVSISRVQCHGGNSCGDELTSAAWASCRRAACRGQAENSSLCGADSPLAAGRALCLAISTHKKRFSRAWSPSRCLPPGLADPGGPVPWPVPLCRVRALRLGLSLPFSHAQLLPGSSDALAVCALGSAALWQSYPGARRLLRPRLTPGAYGAGAGSMLQPRVPPAAGAPGLRVPGTRHGGSVGNPGQEE